MRARIESDDDAPDRIDAAASARCVACGSYGLEPHLTVSGRSGREGLIPTTDRYGTALSDIVRCPRCGHMQLEHFPPAAELEAAYGDAASEDYIAEEAGQRATARRVLATIERHTPRGQLLDLGCWVGYLLSEADARGWRGIGVEPSEFASRYARERLGLDVRTAGLLEVELPADSFRTVVLGDVIEHLPRADLALDRIASLLAPDGVLAMTLPDAGSRVARMLGARWWSVIPTHVHYFTRGSIATLLARRGYRVLSIETSPKVFTVGYYLGRLAGYNASIGRGLVRVANRIGVADRATAPDLRDRMLVIASRAPRSS